MNRLPRLPPDRPRRGYSLLELVVVISMSAVATGGSLVCISTILRGERLTAAAVQESQVVARLRQTWSEDVHLAQAWNVGSVEQDGGSQCDLSLKDGRKVLYRSSSWGLLRQVQRNGQPEEQGVFQFPEGTRFQFQQVEEPRLARLKVVRPAIDSRVIAGGSSDSAPNVLVSANVLGSVVMTFDAASGREARLLESLQTQPEAK